LARAATPHQAAHIGDQTGGRVFLFLHTDDFARDHGAFRSRGVVFTNGPRDETYGRSPSSRSLRQPLGLGAAERLGRRRVGFLCRRARFVGEEHFGRGKARTGGVGDGRRHEIFPAVLWTPGRNSRLTRPSMGWRRGGVAFRPRGGPACARHSSSKTIPTQRHLAALVRDRDYEPIQSESGEEGLRLARERKPDVLFLDLMLPDLDATRSARR